MRLKTHTVLALLCLAFPLHAQIDTNAPTKPISLQECIGLALQNNFTIAIARYEPRIAAYNVGVSYGYYDPQFQLAVTQSKSTTEGEFDPATGLRSRGQETETTSINGNPILAGVFPTGLRYNVFADTQNQTAQGPSEIGFVDRPPINSSTSNNIPLFGIEQSEFYSSRLGIALEQPLLRDFWIDAGRRNIQLMKKDVRISEYELLFTIMDIVRQVQLAYYDLIRFRETAKARQKGVELAERLLTENRKRIEVGTMAPLDEKQAESEAALRRAEMIDAERQAAFQENVLKNLISNQYQEWHPVTLVPTEALLAIPQTYDIQESWLSALERRPDYAQLKELVERQGIEVKYAFNQLFPYLGLVGTYGRRGFDQLLYTNQFQGTLPNGSQLFRRVPANEPSFSGSTEDIADGTAPYYSFGAVLRFPLTFKSERNNHKAAKEAHEQAKMQVQQLHQGILAGIDDAIKEAKAAFELVQAMRKAREFAEQALEAEQKKLDNGRSTSFNVLQLQEDMTDRRALEIEALARYNIALAVLYFREGRILEKNSVKVEVSK